MNTTRPHAAGPSLVALAYTTISLFMYVLMVIALVPRLGHGTFDRVLGVVELMLLPPLGAAYMVLVIWMGLEQVALILAGLVGPAAWVLVAWWGLDAALLYAVGLSCGAVPGVVWYWHRRPERLSRSDLGWAGGAVVMTSVVVILMPGWLTPEIIAIMTALFSVLLAWFLIREAVAQPGPDLAWTRLGVRVLVLAGLVAVPVYVASRTGSVWAVLVLVPPLVLVPAAVTRARRAGVDNDVSPPIGPAVLVGIVLAFSTCTLEALRAMSFAQRIGVGVLLAVGAILLVVFRARVASAFGKARKKFSTTSSRRESPAPRR